MIFPLVGEAPDLAAKVVEPRVACSGKIVQCLLREHGWGQEAKLVGDGLLPANLGFEPFGERGDLS